MYKKIFVLNWIFLQNTKHCYEAKSRDTLLYSLFLPLPCTLLTIKPRSSPGFQDYYYELPGGKNENDSATCMLIKHGIRAAIRPTAPELGRFNWFTSRKE
jgi:hypothetical protein